MNRRTALGIIIANFFAALVSAFFGSPQPRPITFTTADDVIATRAVSFVIVEGRDADGRPVREVVEIPDDGEAVVTEHQFASFTITVCVGG